MGSFPTGRVDVVAVATPPDRVEMPSDVAPLVNSTVPVTPDGRVAVKVTDWPFVEGFVDEIMVTTGVAFVTVWEVAPVAGLLFESPPKVAVIGSLPTGRVVVVMMTVPVTGLIVPVPTGLPPLVIVTVPVVPTGSVVVIVTGLPNVLGPDVVTVTVGVALLTVWVRFAVAVLLFASPL
jgi:hypothetical protein